ncbi:catalase-like domain-containing protein [Biscogniauxia mediterranea]|nr:catalase-like domain-containing protein [Biscogniauxia mediterranea]
MIGNSTPTVFITDGVKFPTFIHTQKRNPQTNLKDATSFRDFLSSDQETVHAVIHLFSGCGNPLRYRHIRIHSGHTIKFTKKDESFRQVKIRVLASQGNETTSSEESERLTGANPDWHTQDLFNAT